MAQVTCGVCGLEYDDTYRLTYCPHEAIEMHTLAVNEAGEEKVCTSVEQLNAHLGVRQQREEA